VTFQAELARITRRDREAIWLHMYVDAYGGLFETLNLGQWMRGNAPDRRRARDH
jgi:hypothetical protein